MQNTSLSDSRNMFVSTDILGNALLDTLYRIMENIDSTVCFLAVSFSLQRLPVFSMLVRPPVALMWAHRGAPPEKQCLPGRLDPRSGRENMRAVEQGAWAHNLSRRWGHVVILYRRLTWAQGWPCSSIGYESSVHCFCIYVAHLGQVHSFIDSATSICLSSEEEGTKTYLGPKA
ncbi:hypothetical protein GH733_005474 [Mirounga leonina]|nr:hypothetical protein GH733_005474 [Mirounga leonina]